MLCLVVSIAHPDYKRPGVDTSIYFFETEQEALCKLTECKILFIADHDTSEDPRIQTLTIESPVDLIDEFFDKISDIDDFYADSYMDNPPFFWKICEVKPGLEIKF